MVLVVFPTPRSRWLYSLSWQSPANTWRPRHADALPPLRLCPRFDCRVLFSSVALEPVCVLFSLCLLNSAILYLTLLAQTGKGCSVRLGLPATGILETAAHPHLDRRMSMTDNKAVKSAALPFADIGDSGFDIADEMTSSSAPSVRFDIRLTLFTSRFCPGVALKQPT